MLIGAAVLVCIGLKMVIEGIVHTISGEPIQRRHGQKGPVALNN
jgi:putative Mn2+ efflux pump MntP